jgi:transposase
MIDPDKRKAIFLLHQEGMGIRQIARRLRVSRNLVRRVIKEGGQMPAVVHADKQLIDEQLLRDLYQRCQGRVQRMHEILLEEYKIQVSYPTLTRRLRQLGISTPSKQRCDRVADEPGLEMQHDTTVYTVLIGGQRTRVVASLLYLRYSKRRYLKFYRNFDRFKMKCFLHEALMFWGYAPGQCIIDNTNLARLRGTGSAAVIVPEMEVFAKNHGFLFRCHALKHPNRKAGEERSLFTAETNFLPGRDFKDMEDLNAQAFQWATVRMENRPQGKAGLIPAVAFEHERGYLIELPAHLPAPYRDDERDIDQYGYVAFDGNYYWVPGTGRGVVKILEYADRLKIFLQRELLAEYPLPAAGVKNQLFSPQGQPVPRYRPKNRRRPTQEEEKRLRAMDPTLNAYLDFALKDKGLKRHGFLRKLFALSRKLTTELFLKTIQRAFQYQITDLETIDRIALLYLSEGLDTLPWAEVDEHFRDRPAYQDGALTEAPDLSIYDEGQGEDDRKAQAEDKDQDNDPHNPNPDENHE